MNLFLIRKTIKRQHEKNERIKINGIFGVILTQTFKITLFLYQFSAIQKWECLAITTQQIRSEEICLADI